MGPGLRRGDRLVYIFIMDNASKSQNDWKLKLTPEQYHVMREGGTEPAFTGKYWNDHSAGMYKCAACGAELFSSDTKFDSGTGWPSFTSPAQVLSDKTSAGKPANLEHVELRDDSSFGTKRTEVICKNCGSHLGHVFDDGPVGKGGKRYCINSVCLELEKKD
jgi:peptide-methionine (R)-S-oxide reductase